jgi:hypothetical protein
VHLLHHLDELVPAVPRPTPPHPAAGSDIAAVDSFQSEEASRMGAAALASTGQDGMVVVVRERVAMAEQEQESEEPALQVCRSPI